MFQQLFKNPRIFKRKFGKLSVSQPWADMDMKEDSLRVGVLGPEGYVCKL